MKILKVNSMSGVFQYHVVLKEKKDEYVVDGGHIYEERAVWEYEFKVKHKLPFCNYTIPKKDVEEVITSTKEK